MKFLLSFLLIGVGLASEKTLSFGGSGIECASRLEFKFGLDKLIIKNENDALVSLDIPNKPTRMVKGEPDLPLFREFVALPHLGDWKVVVEDVVTVQHNLNGKRVIPSKGELLLKQNPADFPLIFGDAYSSHKVLPTALLHPLHKMRDVHGTILEINPVTYNPTTAMLDIVVSCTLRIVSSETFDYVSKIVDATFYDLYGFHYINFHHYAGTQFIKGDDLGRMIVFYDNQFKDSATKFATWKKAELKDVLLEPCGSSSSTIKSSIKTHFNEPDSLTYVVLFGTSCPTFNCQVSRRECDVQYAQLSSLENDVTLDVFVSRIAAASQRDVDAQLDKFQTYSSFNANGTDDWHHHTAGLALDLIGDEYKFMHRNLDAMTKFGFTQADYMQDNSASSNQVYSDWNKGMGMYFYIGHGSGTAWNCPQHTGGFPMSAINSKLTNAGMYPFVLECSCLNGGFKRENPCFAAAMMSASKKGPISMYSSAPEAQSSSPKDLQSGAVDSITSKAATRVGPIYYAGIMYAYKLHPSQALYTLQGYNMFGDPSLQLSFLK